MDSIARADAILEAVARYFNVLVETLRAHTRTPLIVKVRDLLLYLVKENTELSYTEIAVWFGTRHATSVMLSHKREAERTRRRLRWKNRMTHAEAQQQIMALVSAANVPVELEATPAPPPDPEASAPFDADRDDDLPEGDDFHA